MCLSLPVSILSLFKSSVGENCASATVQKPDVNPAPRAVCAREHHWKTVFRERKTHLLEITESELSEEGLLAAILPPKGVCVCVCKYVIVC